MKYTDLRSTTVDDSLLEGVDTIKSQISRLRRVFGSDSKSSFKSGWNQLETVLVNPNRFISEFSSRYPTYNTSTLGAVLMNMREDDTLRDKEAYLRTGYETRGFCGTNSACIWIRDNDRKQEDLHMFSKNDAALDAFVNYLRFCGIVR